MREFGARLTLRDQMSEGLRRNVRQQQEFSRQVQNSRRAVQDLGRTSANPRVDVNDRATPRVNRIAQALRSMSNERYLTRAEVQDRASQTVSNIRARLREIATTYTPIVRIRDRASQGLARIKNTIGGLVRRAITPVIPHWLYPLSTQKGW